jgi:hypothetical protein
MGSIPGESGLFADGGNEPLAAFLFGVRDNHRAGARWVNEDMM